MSRTVPLLYSTAVALLVAAGIVLSLRTAATAPAAGRVPEGCASVPAAVVAELFPDATPRPADVVSEEGVPYGRWVDADGTLLVELRCARVPYAEALASERLRERAASDGDDGLHLLDTVPEAVLIEWRDGVLIEQLDAEQRLQRTWFVRDRLTPAAARQVVEDTGAPGA